MGFMSPALSQEILEATFNSDKQLYRSLLISVAEARKVRPAFYERKARQDRHPEMALTLSRPWSEEAAGNLLRGWLLKSQTAIITEFLDALGIAHEKGVVKEFPESVEDSKLAAAVDMLLSKHPKETVAVYLHTIASTSVPNWKNLEKLLQDDPRLQLG